MSRNEIKLNNLFESEMISLEEMLCEYYYSVPIYQRDYSWDKKAVERLLTSISEGISNLERNEGSVTFMGTILCTKIDRKQCPNFSCRNAFSVVDGQQRLTTLLLLCSVVHQYIAERKHLLSTNKTTDEFKFFDTECEHLDSVLHDSMLAKYESRGSGHKNFFPRVIREMDDSWKSDNANYNSPVADYIVKYKEHIDQQNEKSCYKKFVSNSTEDEHLKKNINSIKQYINKLCGDRNTDKDSDEMIFLPRHEKMVENESYRNILFKSIEECQRREELKKILKEQPAARELLYCIAFSNYMLERAAFSFIETPEEYAFDIFEALNTTGEPLTAIETLKPLVVDAKNKQGENAYKDPKCLKLFNKIDGYLRKEKRFSSLEKQQNESAEIVVNFALLYSGDKLLKRLSPQRTYLRERFDRLTKGAHKDKFIKSIYGVVNYRKKFWTNDDLSDVTSIKDETTLFCLLFLKKIKMSITVPILARYYTKGDPSRFYEVVKALSSFVVIWRAYHGGTKDIDGIFRTIMSGERKSKRDNGNRPACMGKRFENRLLGVKSLKRYFLEFLEKGSGSGSLDDKNKWVKHVIKNHLYTGANKSLCRFMLLASMHQAGPKEDKEYPFLLGKERSSPNKDYMTIDAWKDQSLETIEHVAPQKSQDDKVSNELIDTIGNLILFPEKENSIIGNKPWKDKREYIRIFSEKKHEKIEDRIEEAKNKGIKISRKAKSLMHREECLPTISHLATVEDWNDDVINKRSENLALLTWGEIRPWLD